MENRALSTDSGPARSWKLIDGFAQRLRRARLLSLVVVAMVFVTGYFLLRGSRVPAVHLRMSAGDALGHRHELAKILAGQAAAIRLHLELISTKGSEESMTEVAEERLDVALVQGGLKLRPEIREVAVLFIEPLHLLVKPSIGMGDFEALRGKRLNLSTPTSGTRQLALQVLKLMGLHPGDYTDETHTYAALQQMQPEALPDGIFLVSALPSEFAELMINQHGYRLMPLPFGEAIALRDRAVQGTTIPAFAYGVVPPVPPQPVQTVGTWLSLVAHRDVPEAAILRLLEATFNREFAMQAQLSPLDASEILRRREFPLHPATVTYLQRDQPLVTGEAIESLENLRSFIVSGLVAVFLAWQWYRGRKSIGLERYLDEVTRIELEILREQQQGPLSGPQSLRYEEQLSRLKSEALEEFSSGRLRGDGAMNSLLTHISDARQCLRRQ